MKYIKLLSLFFTIYTIHVYSMHGLLAKRYEKKPHIHRSSKAILVPAKKENQIKRIVPHSKESIVCSAQGTFHFSSPKEIDLNVFRFIGTNTGGETLKESAQIFSALICVNKFSSMHMDDDQRTLGWIKDLSKRFDCTDIDVARALCTRVGKSRLVMQLGLWLNNGAADKYLAKQIGELKSRGLDVNFSYDKEYPSPLLQCCSDLRVRSATAVWLINNGADVNICTPEGKNAAMLAASCEDSIPATLINHQQLKIDHLDNLNNTLLHHCCSNITAIELLIKRGANPTIKNNDSQAPLDCAKEIGFRLTTIELLENAVANFELR